MITVKRFGRILAALEKAGHAADIAWAERLAPPVNAEEFATAAIYVVVNSGMSYLVAGPIFQRCLEALQRRQSARKVFGHQGKAAAIDTIWQQRQRLFADFLAADDKVEFCQTLPWIGPTTMYHLARDLGEDVAKPDVHLVRLATRDRTSVALMCRRLARATGYRVATIDTVLWRACATSILDSRIYESNGWRKAFRGKPKIKH